MSAQRGRRWELDSAEQACYHCGDFLDECRCVCPYCAESELCVCAIGPDAVCGGG